MSRRALLMALLAIAGLATGCVVASGSPAPPQDLSSASPATAGASPSAPTSAAATASPASRIIPWVDRPVAAYVAPTPVPYPTDARACQAADLAASAGDVGAGLGNINLPVSFRNVSDSTCVLKGQPTIAGLRSDGTVVVLRVSQGSYFGDPGPPANLAPGAVGALDVSGGDSCSQRVYPKLRIGLPGGGSLDVAAGGFDTGCGVSVSQFGVPADAVPAVNPPQSPLTAEIIPPVTVVAGTTLRYTVTLTNPSSTNVSLSPCPAYQEFVGSGSTTWVATVRNYQLNCDATTVIRAASSVTYHMELALPADQPGGRAKFGWSLQGDSGPWANALLEVLPAGG